MKNNYQKLLDSLVAMGKAEWDKSLNADDGYEITYFFKSFDDTFITYAHLTQLKKMFQPDKLDISFSTTEDDQNPFQRIELMYKKAWKRLT